MKVKAYEVTVCGASMTVNTTSLGKAKAQIFWLAREHFADVRFTNVRGRKIADCAVMTPKLEGVMRQRGRPDLGPGVEVVVNGRKGVVVDGTDCANFAVLYEDGACYAVHPLDIAKVP